jgi:2,3-bisphosphoglycerate-independent phosphoglycerate mutase
MTQYDEDFGLPFIFERPGMDRIFGQVVSEAGLTQLRAAETEKYAHVTYFFNGGDEDPFPGEDRLLVQAPKVATYDLQPEMSANELTEKVSADIVAGKHDVYIVNYANPDMVGHTGVFDAAVAAVEAVDSGLGALLDALVERDGIAVVTADHGNADEMLLPNGEPHTFHTTNPVPCVLVGSGFEQVELSAGGALRDLAPTMLELLGLDKPEEMDGKSLLVTQKESST